MDILSGTYFYFEIRGVPIRKGNGKEVCGLYNFNSRNKKKTEK